jgi:hypothetical protein
MPQQLYFFFPVLEFEPNAPPLEPHPQSNTFFSVDKEFRNSGYNGVLSYFKTTWASKENVLLVEQIFSQVSIYKIFKKQVEDINLSNLEYSYWVVQMTANNGVPVLSNISCFVPPCSFVEEIIC